MTDWAERACRDKPVDLFYPDPADERGNAAAKAVCVRCACKDACLDRALERREEGVWGALSERERAPYLSRPQRSVHLFKRDQPGTTEHARIERQGRRTHAELVDRMSHSLFPFQIEEGA